jgi:hypothetical protein
MKAHEDAPRCDQVATNVVLILSFAGGTDKKKTKLEQTLPLQFHCAPIHTANLTFTSFAANHSHNHFPLY